MMELSTVSFLVFLCIACANAQIFWHAKMERLNLAENTENGKSIYQLNATYQGSNDNIIYGINNNPTDLTDNSIKQEGNRFQVFPNGTVFTYNVELDFEGTEKEFSVNFIAVLTTDDSIFSKTTGKVIVRDENDNPPLFEKNDYEATVRENQVPPREGTQLVTGISVSDADTNPSPPVQFITCTITGCRKGTEGTESPCGDYFEIRPRNNDVSQKGYFGDFFIMQPLDYENASVWQVTLTSYDGRDTDAADVVIRVLDVQDAPPTWVKLPTQLTHFDGTPRRSNLGTLLAVDGDGDINNRRNISYELLDTTDPNIGADFYPELYFGIDQFTGEVYNKVPLDLESRPFNVHPDNNRWRLLVRACEIISDDPFEVGTTVGLDCTDGRTAVVIKDINDNRPEFTNATYVYKIPEDVRNGESLNIPAIEIIDLDSDQYNKFSVRFTSISNEFKLSVSDRSPVIQVKNTSLIDYDNGPRRYDLTIIAVDNDNNLLSSTANVIIHILDANDNKPVFPQAEYIVSIFEDAPPRTNIIRITATDIDEGLKGTAGIRYSLEGYNERNLFEIGATDGQVIVGPCSGTPGVFPCIDYERTPNEYRFKVKAQDEEGDGPRPSYASLIIRILDRNDNPPVVQDYEVNIFEMQTVTTPDLYVKATDPDEADIPRLRYSIASQPVVNGRTYWQIDPELGHITATEPILYSFAPKSRNGTGQARFTLEVLVTDTKHNVFSTVTIRVIDINDNTPVFIPRDYTETIPETTLGGVSILTVYAEDADDATVANGQIRFLISSGANGKFDINEENGTIVTSADAFFDFDKKAVYELIVIAYDLGVPQLSGTGTVTVSITDENNKDPQFVPFSQRMVVFDNAPIGFLVGFLTASDPDDNAKLRYYFNEPKSAINPLATPVDRNIYNFTHLFRLNDTNGAVIVNQLLDYDKARTVTYAATVKDEFPPVHQEGRGTVIIDIKDYNTIAPRFDPFDDITFPEEQGEGSFVMSLVARDDDGVIRGYEIVEQPHDFFEISYESGFVTTSRNKIDYDDDRMINSSYIVVVVTDSGEPTLSATATVTINIRNINDNTPIFSKSIYVAELDENEVDGTSVITVTATDADRPDHYGYSEVRYTMDDDRFDIEPISGKIFVRLRNGAVLDREKTPILRVPVIAYDTPNGPVSVRREEVASVSITLRDKNDNPPVFFEEIYRDVVYETIPVDRSLLQVRASDADLGLFADISYYKVPNVGNDYLDFFGVREGSGHIYVKKDLVGHARDEPYRFQVLARDEKGSGPFRGTVFVEITILPAANSPPVWVIPPKDNATIEVLEEQYKGLFVIQVRAEDPDTGPNGIVDYMFVHEGNENQTTGSFYINRITGVIHAEIEFDRERQDKYVLLLKAKDRGDTKLEATRFLTVVIIDVNDNEPYFKEEMIEFRVKEDAPIGTEVKDSIGNKKIEAFDRDLNPEIYYDVISGNEEGDFRIDRDTGKLYTNNVLDSERKAIYELIVRATNDEPDDTVIRYRRRRQVQESSILRVKIIVGDINDEAPVFLGEPYYGCVSSRSPFDKHIVTVSAVDYDAVGSGVVKYRLMNEINNGEGQPLFGIHNTFGVISNKVLMPDYTDNIYELKVNARDREDIAQAESVNTTVQIYVTQPGKEAKLLIKQNTAEVRLYQNQIQRIIEQSQYLDRLCINLVRDHVINTAGERSPLWSDVYISGIVTDGAGGARIVSAVELKNIIETEMNNRPKDFENLYISTVEPSSSDETSVKESFVLIVMIIIGILIFLVILFIILAYLCIRAAKAEKKSRLIQKTQAGPAPVPIVIEKHVVEPPAVFEAPEPVQYDNRAYVIEQQGPPPPQEQMVVEPEPVHVQYAVVQKRPLDLETEVIRVPTPEPVDQEDIIIVSQFRDEPQPAGEDVFQPAEEEAEFRIVTEPM